MGALIIVVSSVSWAKRPPTACSACRARARWKAGISVIDSNPPRVILPAPGTTWLVPSS